MPEVSDIGTRDQITYHPLRRGASGFRVWLAGSLLGISKFLSDEPVVQTSQNSTGALGISIPVTSYPTVCEFIGVSGLYPRCDEQRVR